MHYRWWVSTKNERESERERSVLIGEQEVPVCFETVGGKQTPSIIVYDILPTTAIIDYATGLGKLLANGQFFDGDQEAVCL